MKSTLLIFYFFIFIPCDVYASARVDGTVKKCRTRKLDFEEFENGQYIGDLTDSYGLQISARGTNGGGYTPNSRVRIYDPKKMDGLRPLCVSNPGNNKDTGKLCENDRSANSFPDGKTSGKLIIIQRSADGVPSESSEGGTIVFEWGTPVNVKNMEFLSIDDTDYPSLSIFYDDGTTQTSNLPWVGNNGYYKRDINKDRVVKIEYKLRSSGFIAGAEWEDCSTPAMAARHLQTCTNITLDFSDFETGEYLTNLTALGYPVTISALSKTSKGYTPWGAARIFDTFRPSGLLDTNNKYHQPLCSKNEGVAHLGSPNEAFNGPGVGKGGAESLSNGDANPYRNEIPQGKVLIIQEGDKSCPVDSGDGGVLRFDFDNPVTLHQLTTLGVTEGDTPEVVVLYGDGQRSDFMLPATGKNGVVSQQINLDGVVWLQIKFHGSGSISEVQWTSCPPAQLDVPKYVPNDKLDECVEDQVVDFSHFNAGDYILDQTVDMFGFSVRSKAATDQGSFTPFEDSMGGAARIFDTRYPIGNFGNKHCALTDDNAGDVDLGSPNFYCRGGGPGFGDSGKPGSVTNFVITENCKPQGNVLITQERDVECPDATIKGSTLYFRFVDYVELDYVELFDTDAQPTHIKVHYNDGKTNRTSEMQSDGTGDNGVKKHWISLSGVYQIDIFLCAAGGISSLQYSRCPPLRPSSSSVENTRYIESSECLEHSSTLDAIPDRAGDVLQS